MSAVWRMHLAACSLPCSHIFYSILLLLFRLCHTSLSAGCFVTFLPAGLILPQDLALLFLQAQLLWNPAAALLDMLSLYACLP